MISVNPVSSKSDRAPKEKRNSWLGKLNPVIQSPSIQLKKQAAAVNITTTVNTTPFNTTPVNTTPFNTSPVNTTPVNTTPFNTTPVDTTTGNTATDNTTTDNTVTGYTIPDFASITTVNTTSDRFEGLSIPIAENDTTEEWSIDRMMEDFHTGNSRKLEVVIEDPADDEEEDWSERLIAQVQNEISGKRAQERMEETVRMHTEPVNGRGPHQSYGYPNENVHSSVAPSIDMMRRDSDFDMESATDRNNTFYPTTHSRQLPVIVEGELVNSLRLLGEGRLELHSDPPKANYSPFSNILAPMPGIDEDEDFEPIRTVKERGGAIRQVETVQQKTAPRNPASTTQSSQNTFVSPYLASFMDECDELFSSVGEPDVSFPPMPVTPSPPPSILDIPTSPTMSTTPPTPRSISEFPTRPTMPAVPPLSVSDVPTRPTTPSSARSAPDAPSSLRSIRDIPSSVRSAPDASSTLTTPPPIVRRRGEIPSDVITKLSPSVQTSQSVATAPELKSGSPPTGLRRLVSRLSGSIRVKPGGASSGNLNRWSTGAMARASKSRTSMSSEKSASGKLRRDAVKKPYEERKW